jgi:hypothetical protein
MSMDTEQCPKELGHTVPEIKLAKFGINPHSKTCFTIILPQPVMKSIILCEIEKGLYWYKKTDKRPPFHY